MKKTKLISGIIPLLASALVLSSLAVINSNAQGSLDNTRIAYVVSGEEGAFIYTMAPQAAPLAGPPTAAKLPFQPEWMIIATSIIWMPMAAILHA